MWTRIFRTQSSYKVDCNNVVADFPSLLLFLKSLGPVKAVKEEVD
ncbi:MAG: hypothetical protein AABY93_08165 [Bacteroidota bacterium]